jgi:hypothetical protein
VVEVVLVQQQIFQILQSDIVVVEAVVDLLLLIWVPRVLVVQVVKVV